MKRQPMLGQAYLDLLDLLSRCWLVIAATETTP